MSDWLFLGLAFAAVAYGIERLVCAVASGYVTYRERH